MIKTPNLFTNVDQIIYDGVYQTPTDTGSFIDFYLYQTALDRAILSYDVEAQLWAAMLCETETSEDGFEDDYDATTDQIDALVASLPAEAWEEVTRWIDARRQLVA